MGYSMLIVSEPLRRHCKCLLRSHLPWPFSYQHRQMCLMPKRAVERVRDSSCPLSQKNYNTSHPYKNECIFTEACCLTSPPFVVTWQVTHLQYVCLCTICMICREDALFHTPFPSSSQLFLCQNIASPLQYSTMDLDTLMTGFTGHL